MTLLEVVSAAAAAALGSGAVTAVVTRWLHRRRDDAEVGRLRGERDQAHADAAAAITVAATTLIAPLQARVEQLARLVDQQAAELLDLRPLRAQVDQLQAENAGLHADLDGLRAENARLRAQLRGLRADLDERLTGQLPGAGG